GSPPHSTRLAPTTRSSTNPPGLAPWPVADDAQLALDDDGGRHVQPLVALAPSRTGRCAARRACRLDEDTAGNLVGQAVEHEHEAPWGASPDTVRVEVGEPDGAEGGRADLRGGEVRGRKGKQQRKQAGYPVGSSGRGAPGSKRARTPTRDPS